MGNRARLLISLASFQVLALRNPEPVPISRFALCLSGGWRTLQYTSARLGEFLETNPGTDVFLVLGRDNKVAILSL